MPRLIVGAVYKKTGDTMKVTVHHVYTTILMALQLLWTDKLCLNTVHVDDVARALWHLAQHGALGQIYNLVDKGDSSAFSAHVELCDLHFCFTCND